MSAAWVDRLYLLAAAACGVGGAAGLVARGPWERTKRARRLWGAVISILAIFVLAVWGLRWRAAGHLPLFGTYESALSLASAVMVAGWLWEYRGGFRTTVAPVAALVAAAVLVHGSTFNPTIYALTISERSWVVDVHAFFAWSAFGVLATNVAGSVRVLTTRTAEPEQPSELVTRTLEIGFVLHTGMMITGSFYKFLLFGKAWSFDPIETMGLVAWISYGTLLHMTRFASWKGKQLARWCLLLFVLLVVSYRFIVYFPSWSTYHILDMDLRMHVPG